MHAKNKFALSALIFMMLSCGSEQGPPIEPTNNAAIGNEAERVAVERAAHRAKIERILNEDAQASRLGSTAATASAMRQINIDAAPSDFRQAYFAHIHAWEDIARIDEQFRYLNSPEATDEAWRRWWIETFRGSSETPVSDLESAKARIRDRRSAANEVVRTTFQAVERIAIAYDARLPAPADTSGNTM